MTSLFISAATVDYKADREKLAASLNRPPSLCCVHQEGLTPSGHPSLVMLARNIDASDAVVTFIGPNPGCRPEPLELEVLEGVYPEVWKKLEGAGCELARVTYTQWEGLLAAAFGKRVYVAERTDPHSTDSGSHNSDEYMSREDFLKAIVKLRRCFVKPLIYTNIDELALNLVFATLLDSPPSARAEARATPDSGGPREVDSVYRFVFRLLCRFGTKPVPESVLLEAPWPEEFLRGLPADAISELRTRKGLQSKLEALCNRGVLVKSVNKSRNWFALNKPPDLLGETEHLSGEGAEFSLAVRQVTLWLSSRVWREAEQLGSDSSCELAAVLALSDRLHDHGQAVPEVRVMDIVSMCAREAIATGSEAEEQASELRIQIEHVANNSYSRAGDQDAISWAVASIGDSWLARRGMQATMKRANRSLAGLVGVHGREDWLLQLGLGFSRQFLLYPTVECADPRIALECWKHHMAARAELKDLTEDEFEKLEHVRARRHFAMCSAAIGDDGGLRNACDELSEAVECALEYWSSYGPSHAPAQRTFGLELLLALEDLSCLLEWTRRKGEALVCIQFAIRLVNDMLVWCSDVEWLEAYLTNGTESATRLLADWRMEWDGKRAAFVGVWKLVSPDHERRNWWSRRRSVFRHLDRIRWILAKGGPQSEVIDVLREILEMMDPEFCAEYELDRSESLAI